MAFPPKLTAGKKVKLGRIVSSLIEKHAGPIFMFPAAAIILFVLTFPVLASLFYSVTDKNLLMPDQYRFVGLQNFKEVLQDDRYWTAFKNSLYWTAGSVSLQMVLGLAAALLLNRIAKLRSLFRTLLIVPWAFPSIVIAFTWSWLLNDSYGYLNSILLRWKLIDMPILWFGKPALSMFSMILINGWFGFPFIMVTILAGLQTIPREEFEAASIDGASALQQFKHITWVYISKIMGLLAILRSIWVFNNFEMIFLTTGGGPGTSTETLPLFSYRTGWMLSSIGKASAIATMLFLILLVFTLLYLKLLGGERKDRI